MIKDSEIVGYEYPELESELEAPPEDDNSVSTESKDWTVSALSDKYRRGKIDLQPEYQREYVWALKPELPSRLIESLLLDIPIPPIYFAQMSGGNLEVIDGQQRLTTLVHFLDNKMSLQKLHRISSLNDRAFKDLSDDQQEKILDSQIRSVVIDTGSNPDLRYEVFERLNRGSVALNEQELRNSIYRGPFRDLLSQLEKDTFWRRVKGSNEPEPRFKEREIILRFFAFANRIDQYRGNLKRFLNEYMGTHAPSDPQLLEEQAETFRQAMRNIYSVFGSKSARLYITGTADQPSTDGKWDHKFSVSALDLQASALIGQPEDKVQEAAEQIREAYIFYLLTNSQVRLAISRQPAGTQATKTRWFGFRAKVQEILGDATVESRFFSYDFRRQLYEKQPICRLCSNEIHSFDDSTVDHIIPYSKGGKTAHDNAQLAHRSCNARKCAKLIKS